MAHAIRHEAWLAPQPTSPRAKPLRPTPIAPSPDLTPDRRTTWQSPADRFRNQASGERRRRGANSGNSFSEEVVADLSKDPRHDD